MKKYLSIVSDAALLSCILSIIAAGFMAALDVNPFIVIYVMWFALASIVVSVITSLIDSVWERIL